MKRLEATTMIRRGWGFLEELLKVKRFALGVYVLAGLVLIAIFADFIAPYPHEGYGWVPTNASGRILEPPSLRYPFGTDTVGRDVFSRVIIGTRLALFQAFTVVALSLLIGLFLGIIAAYYRGAIGTFIQYLTEMFMSVPSILVALAIALAIGKGLLTVIISLIMTWWSWYARIAYIYARSVVEMEYVTMAKLSGVSSIKILLRHVLRNVYQPLSVQAITDMGSVLLEAAAINFLGLGVPLSSPEWGVIIYEGKDVLIQAPWLTIFPGIFLLISAISFSLVGDVLREYVDPRLRKKWRLWF